MKASVLLCVLLAVFVASTIAKTKWHQLDTYTFGDYVKEFNKHYERGEHEWRETLFLENLAEIRAHNQGNFSWKKGVNHLSDRTHEEKRAMLGFNKALGAKYQAKAVTSSEFDRPVAVSAPPSLDYRDQNIISTVKDQGSCGSCWTFATAETVESYYAKATGHLDTLSEQQIASCVDNVNDCGGTGGCGGGIAEIAYEQIISQGGLASEWTYPYISYQGVNYDCKFSTQKTPPVAVLSNYTVLTPNSYNSVFNALVDVGPLAVNVDATAWHSYESGVFNGCNQVNPDINHVVQLIGYGTDSTTSLPYWLVRNSWSPTWGEDGFIRLFRDYPAVCGVDLLPQDGTGCNGGPANVTTCGTCGILYSVTYPTIKV